MRLIDDWRQAWKFHTVVLAALLGALNWVADHPNFFTPDIAAALATVLPPDVMSAINRWVPLVLIVLRLVRQNIPARDAPPSPADPAQPKESP